MNGHAGQDDHTAAFQHLLVLIILHKAGSMWNIANVESGHRNVHGSRARKCTIAPVTCQLFGVIVASKAQDLHP